MPKTPRIQQFPGNQAQRSRAVLDKALVVALTNSPLQRKPLRECPGP